MAESQFSIEKEILSIRWNGGRMSRKIIWIAITVIAVVAGSILLYNMFYRERESQAAVEEFEEYTGTEAPAWNVLPARRWRRERP